MLANGYRCRASATLAALAALAIGLAATADAEIVEIGGQGPPAFGFRPSLSPHILSSTEQMPVKLGLLSQFSSAPGFARPSALSQVRLRLDRHLDISTRGLPACSPRLQLELVGPGGVPEHCKPALVGNGKAEIFIAYPEGKGIPLEPEVLLYNGGTRKGVTRLWIYMPVTVPVPGAITAPVEVKKIDQGRLGTEAVISLPQVADGYGAFERLSLNINRKYTFKDQPRSVATFRCADGTFQASGEAIFADATPPVLQDAIRPCGVAD